MPGCGFVGWRFGSGLQLSGILQLGTHAVSLARLTGFDLNLIVTNRYSATAHSLPGHSFSISTSAIETIRYKAYGLRTRQPVVKKPRADRIPDGSRNLDHASDGEDGFVRSSNECEFDHADDHQVDGMEEYCMR